MADATEPFTPPIKKGFRKTLKPLLLLCDLAEDRTPDPFIKSELLRKSIYTLNPTFINIHQLIIFMHFHDFWPEGGHYCYKIL